MRAGGGEPLDDSSERRVLPPGVPRWRAAEWASGAWAKRGGKRVSG